MATEPETKSRENPEIITKTKIHLHRFRTYAFVETIQGKKIQKNEEKKKGSLFLLMLEKKHKEKAHLRNV